MIIACAGIFAHAGSTLGAFDALAKVLLSVTSEEHLMLAMIMLLLLIAGMLLDAASIFLIFLPILVPVVTAFGWDMTWFAVLIIGGGYARRWLSSPRSLTVIDRVTGVVLMGFGGTLLVNLLVTTRVAGIGVEDTVQWVIWLVLAMLAALALVAAFPQLALWLPGKLGY